MGDQTLVDSEKVSDSETPIFFGLTYIIPGAEGNRIGRVILNSSPPKPPNDSSDPFNKSFGEKNNGHVVYRNRGKNRFDVGESASMVKFIGFDGGEFGAELVENEIVSLIPIPVTKNHWMTKVHSIRKQVLNRKNAFNLGFGGTINIFAKEDGGFMVIRNLPG